MPLVAQILTDKLFEKKYYFIDFELMWIVEVELKYQFLNVPYTPVDIVADIVGIILKFSYDI